LYQRINAAISRRAKRREAREQVLPDALLFQTPEETLDDIVLFGRVRCDVRCGYQVER